MRTGIRCFCNARLPGLAFSFGLLLFVIILCACQRPEKHSDKTTAVYMVRAGVPTGVVVLSADAGVSAREAVQEFVKIVARSTGAVLPIYAEGDPTIPAQAGRLYVGCLDYDKASSPPVKALPVETYCIVTRGNAVYIMGADELPREDGVVSRPTLWALNKLLETQLGVRWLWPGELGTYVPQHRDFAIPTTNLTYQPVLMSRNLRVNLKEKASFAVRDLTLDKRLRQEALLWAESHLCGRRGDLRFGHAFGDWWKKYSATRPDFFAELPDGIRAPYPRASRVKLRLANPDVIEQIAQEYSAAGAPHYYNVCPNDGSGFDISAETRAWDIPQEQPIKDIFSAKGNLTARYVEFWNRLYKRLAIINSEVVLASYAYSSYRLPPPPGRPLQARMVLGVVDTYNAYDNWEKWAASGAQLFLRPNWWHQGADAPYLPLKKTADFVKFAGKNGMIGLDMDSILGYWATQGINYYLVARLMTNPDLEMATILAEYASAFGKGAPAIMRYLAYWQAVSDAYSYPLNAADENDSGPSKYQDLVRAGKVPSSILNGSTYALPYLYSDEVLAPAEAILTETEKLIGATDEESMQRVAFLRLGLTSMRATRDQIARAQALLANPNKIDLELLAQFKTGAEQLEALRDGWAEKHVIWARSIKAREDRYKIALRPDIIGRSINLDGM